MTKWNSTFTILMIIEGTTEKVFQLILSLMSIYILKNFGFIQQNVFLNTKERFKQENFKKNYIFYHKVIALYHLFIL